MSKCHNHDIDLAHARDVPMRSISKTQKAFVPLVLIILLTMTAFGVWNCTTSEVSSGAQSREETQGYVRDGAVETIKG